MPFSKKAKYIHKEINDIKDFDSRSIRTIELGSKGVKARIGCPKGYYNLSKEKCKVGTKIITKLIPKKARAKTTQRKSKRTNPKRSRR